MIHSKKIKKILFVLLFSGLVIGNLTPAITFDSPQSVQATGSSNTLEKKTVVDQNSPSLNDDLTLISVIIATFIFVFTISAVIILRFQKEKSFNIICRDWKRKHHLEKIRYSLSAFAKTYGRYPDANKGEFLELLEQISPLPVDPLSNQEVGIGSQKYNYYYDNQSLNAQDKGRENTQYYRLWCHLENRDDPDINQIYSKTYKNVYLKTSADPLNPSLLEEPRQRRQKLKRKKGDISTKLQSPEMVAKHRKESLLRFFLFIIGIGLALSAIINGVLYYLATKK